MLYKELYLPTRFEGFMKKFRFLIICIIFIALLALGNLAMAVTPVHAASANLLPTPTPTVTVCQSIFQYGHTEHQSVNLIYLCIFRIGLMI